jgi:hypothetical protein
MALIITNFRSYIGERGVRRRAQSVYRLATGWVASVSFPAGVAVLSLHHCA